jgi:hypothetical protein
MSSDSADNIYAYQDAVDRAVDYLGGNALAQASREIRTGIIEAYDELCGDREWRHFVRPYRIKTELPETGTLSYSASTGLFTIDTGSWPSWAEGATLSVGEVRYRLVSAGGGSTVSCDSNLCPVDDIATGTSFTIFKDIYTLPDNFLSLNRPTDENSGSLWAMYHTPDAWLQLTRYSESTGSPVAWTIMADPVYLGRQAVHFWPAPDSQRTLDMIAKLAPRNINLTGFRSEERVGTVAVSGNTVTGTSTQFTSAMIGSLLRISSDGTNYPDGRGGNNPYAYQRIITAVASATSCTIGGTAISTSGKKYCVTDPLDISRPMLDAFWRGIERKLAGSKKGLQTAQMADGLYMTALNKARAADSSVSQRRSAWDSTIGFGVQVWKDGEDDF